MAPFVDVMGRMLARGAALFSPADAAAAYRDLFPNPDAARMAMKRTEVFPEHLPMERQSWGNIREIGRPKSPTAPTGADSRPAAPWSRRVAR
jgi:hypothetical protein